MRKTVSPIGPTDLAERYSQSAPASASPDATGGQEFTRKFEVIAVGTDTGVDEGGGMAKAYWVNTFRSVGDPQRLAAYIERAGPVMRESGGRYLARGLPARAFEAGVEGADRRHRVRQRRAGDSSLREPRLARRLFARWATAPSATIASSKA